MIRVEPVDPRREDVQRLIDELNAYNNRLYPAESNHHDPVEVLVQPTVFFVGALEGAALLGIGGSTQHRRDKVTVFLRAVSVNSGEVLQSVTATKTIYSVLGQGTVFRYVAADEILEAEAGVSRNEPIGLAVRQAIELAVYRLIVEGAEDGLWAFADAARQREIISRYRDAGRGLPAAEPAPQPTRAPNALPIRAPPFGPVARAARADEGPILLAEAGHAR